MGKINVYLPGPLEQEVRASGLNVSAVCQTALREALHHPKTDDCKHPVVLRKPSGGHRCEVCGNSFDIRPAARKKAAS